MTLVFCVLHRAPVECGSIIRMMHLQTKRNLHSHHFTSPLSHNQEVSGFGDDGVGDNGKSLKQMYTFVISFQECEYELMTLS